MKVKDIKYIKVEGKNTPEGLRTFISENTTLTNKTKLQGLGITSSTIIGKANDPNFVPFSKIDTYEILIIQGHGYMVFSKDYDPKKVKQVFYKWYAHALKESIQNNTRFLEQWESLIEG